jgi:WD40 repeat protein
MWKASVPIAPKKIRFSEDGKRIVAMLEDGSVYAWQADDGKQLMMANGDGYPIDVRFLGASGDRVISVNRGADLKVWSTHSGQLLSRVPMDNTDDSYASNNEGNVIVTTDRLGTISAWDSTWQRDRYQFQIDEGIRHINISTDHRFVTVLGDRGQIREWDTVTGRVLLDVRAPLRDSTVWMSKLATSENGQTIAFLNNQGLLTVWGVGSGEILNLQMPRVVVEFSDKSLKGAVVRGFPKDMNKILYGDCQKQVPLIVGTGDGSISSVIRLCGPFDAASQRFRGEVSTDSYRGPVAVSHDGRFVALGFIDTVFVFDVKSDKLVAKFSQGYDSRNRSFPVAGADFGSATLEWIDFTPGSNYVVTESKPDIVSGEGGNVIRTWSMSNPNAGPMATLVLPDKTKNLGLSAKGDLILVETADGRAVEGLSISTLEQKALFLSDGLIASDPFTFSSGRPRVSVPEYLLRWTFPFVKAPFLYLKTFDECNCNEISRIELPLTATSISMSHDGRNIVLDDGNGFMNLVDASDGHAIAQFVTPGRPREFWFAANGAELYYTNGGSQQYETPLRGSEQINVIPLHPEGLVRQLCGTLRKEDQTFDELSKEAGKSISCASL